MPDLVSLLGTDGSELVEKIMIAENNTQRVEILSHFLEMRLLKTKPYQPAVFSVSIR